MSWYVCLYAQQWLWWIYTVESGPGAASSSTCRSPCRFVGVLDDPVSRPEERRLPTLFHGKAAGCGRRVGKTQPFFGPSRTSGLVGVLV